MHAPAPCLLRCVFVLALLASAPAWAENAAIPYARLEAFQTIFNAIPPAQRDKLTLVVQMVHADKTNHLPIHAWVDVDGQHTAFPVADDGTIHLPERPDWADKGVQLQTDQPRHSLELGLDMLVRPPPGPTIQARYLLDAVRQGNDAMRAGARQMGGYLAMLAAPSSKTVTIALAGCCGGTASLQGGAAPVTIKQSAAGDVVIPLEALRAHEDSVVVLSAPVVRIGLFSD